MLTRPTKPVNSPNSPTITLTHPKSRFRYFETEPTPYPDKKITPKYRSTSYMSTSYAISLGDFTITITATSLLSVHFCIERFFLWTRLNAEISGQTDGLHFTQGFQQSFTCLMQMLNKSGRKIRFKVFHNHNDLWAKLTFSGQYIQSFRFHCPNSNWWFH